MPCLATVPMIACARRNATVARRQIFRAQKAVEIAGPTLRPEFEEKLLGQLGQCNSSALDLIGELNSGALDAFSESQLNAMADSLMKLDFTMQLVLKGSALLAFKRKSEFGNVLATLRSVCNRIGSVREGIALALEPNFLSSLSSSVEELHTNRTLVS